MQPETHIICTLGPASSTSAIIKKMVKVGMDVVRLNFSHGDHESHAKLISTVRHLNNRYGYAIKILQDLEGQRIRVGHLSKPVEITKGDIVQLSTTQENPAEKILPFDYTGLVKDIPLNADLYIDDGRLRFKIIDRQKNAITIRTVVGGELNSRKGINIPDLEISDDALSKKDRDDIDFGIEHKVDFVAQSFVTNAHDIELVAGRIRASHNAACSIFAKIENRPGVKHLDAIIKGCDGIMVARGDLGISIPVYKVPIVQKYILQRCSRLKKQVIIATQMLETMTASPTPTRAEVSDIANAIYDGTDYVMLSGETAVGKYPVQAVRMMNKIAEFSEKSIRIKPAL
ncbi:MAG: pyruvate kinase [Chitinivibrionales bacterium]|nr:pyruvate kinase [Chitinivibrionales bacterium]